MINTQERRRGKPIKPNQWVTGLKCAVCGIPVPDKTWDQLAMSKHDFCEDHKHSTTIADPDEIIMSCIERGKTYWRPVPAKPCREKGITNCTECPYEDGCIIPVEDLDNLYW